MINEKLKEPFRLLLKVVTSLLESTKHELESHIHNVDERITELSDKYDEVDEIISQENLILEVNDLGTPSVFENIEDFDNHYDLLPDDKVLHATVDNLEGFTTGELIELVGVMKRVSSDDPADSRVDRSATFYGYNPKNGKYLVVDWSSVDNNNPEVSYDIVDCISTMVGATKSSAGKSGYVPTPTAGDVDKFLSGDGTWKDTGVASLKSELQNLSKSLPSIGQSGTLIIGSTDTGISAEKKSWGLKISLNYDCGEELTDIVFEQDTDGVDLKMSEVDLILQDIEMTDQVIVYAKFTDLDEYIRLCILDSTDSTRVYISPKAYWGCEVNLFDSKLTYREQTVLPNEGQYITGLKFCGLNKATIEICGL